MNDDRLWVKVAVDAMGGDHAPDEIVKGAIEAVQMIDDVIVYLVGPKEQLLERLEKSEMNSSRIEIIHADGVIGMDDSPVLRDASSSIAVGLNLVKEGKADTFISAGNTGACMAQSVIGLKRIPGIIRPGIPIPVPVGDKYLILIDAGANVDSKKEHLHQFAVMGSIYARNILNIENPRIGILSNGQESKKGNKLSQETYQLLKDTDLNFIGYVEGNTLFEHIADVVVCDGFVGNIVLKICEGFAARLLSMVSEGLVNFNIEEDVVQDFMNRIKKAMDYSEYGGAPLLGVNGTSIICHGSSKAKAIRNAIRLSTKFHKKSINNIIQSEIEKVFQEG